MVPALRTPRPATVAADPGSIWTGTTFVNLIDPNPDEFSLTDIARGLSHANRFSGLTYRPYSVAAHCLTCLNIAHEQGEDTPAILRAILMHDAAEAYLGDVVRPLKQFLPDYRRIEARMEAALWARFNISLPLFHTRVKLVDKLALAAEKSAFFQGSPSWDHFPENDFSGQVEQHLSHNHAADFFLSAARALGVPE